MIAQLNCCELSCSKHGIQITLHSDCISAGYIPRVGMAESHGTSVLRFLRNLQTALYNVCTSVQSHQKYIRIPSPWPILDNIFFSLILGDSHSRWVRWKFVVVFFFHYIFLMASDPGHFSHTYLQFVFFMIWKLPAHVLFPFINRIVWVEFLVDPRCWPFIHRLVCRYFLPFCQLRLHTVFPWLCRAS